MAGPAAVGPCVRAVCADRDRPAGGEALGGVRGTGRGRAGAGPPRGPGVGAGGRGGGAAASRAPARSADARAVPVRSPGGGARGLSQRAPRRWSRRSGSSRAPSCGTCRRRSSRRIPRSIRRRARGAARARSRAAPRCWSGRDRELAELVGAAGRRVRGRGAVVCSRARAGIGKTRLAAELAREASRRRMGVALRGRGARRRARRSLACGARRKRAPDPARFSTTPTMRAASCSIGRRRSPPTAPVGGCCSWCCCAGASRPRAFAAARCAGSSWARSRTTRWPRSRGSTARRARVGRGGGGRERRRPACGAPRGGGWARARAAGADRGERRARREPSAASCAGRVGSLGRSARSARARRARAALRGRGRTRRCRRSAPSLGSPPSTWPTRSTSSVASGSWPSWWRGSWARRCWRWSARRAAGSPRRCAPGCCPALAERRAARLRALALGADAPRRAPAGRARARAAGGRRAGGARRRPVRGGVHGLPRRARADRLPRRAGRAGARTAADASRWWSRCAPTSTVTAPSTTRLARLVGANQVLVGPMRRDELRRAIEEPARRVGLRVEPSLTDALIADVLDEPGGLPLLSAALLEQWRERDGHVMRRAAYERTGGVRGAVGRLAERTYARLRAESARRRSGSCCGSPTPASRAPRSCAAACRSTSSTRADEHTAAALERPGRQPARDRGRATRSRSRTRRCCASGRGCARWLEEDAEGRRAAPAPDARRARLASRGPRPRRALPRRTARRGARLGCRPRARPERARARVPGREPSRGRARGRAAAATNRRLRALLGRLAGLLALAVVAGVVALNQRGEARDAALAADAQRLGVEALNQERLDQALLFARAAVDARRDSRHSGQPAVRAAPQSRRRSGSWTTPSASMARPSARTAS